MPRTFELPITKSFRDPAGYLIRTAGRILRVMEPESAAQLTAFLATSTAERWLGDGKIVGTRMLRPEEVVEVEAEGAVMAEHGRISFPSFPYEWPAEMLHAAGELTLDLAVDALDAGFCLKDATPYNVLFRGAAPVFVDMLSFERRDAHDYVWLPYSQFVRTFLLPLLAARSFDIHLDQVFLSRRDGLEPDTLYGWASFFRRLSPSFLGLVSLPRWMGTRKERNAPELYRRRLAHDPEKAQFILRNLFTRLRRSLGRFAPSDGRQSTWSDYTETADHYSADDVAVKECFVNDFLTQCGPKRLLDIGCNTGHYSEMAAGHGAEVVAIDSDAVAAGKLWRKARARGLNILPLVVDLGRPTPNLGWRYSEQQSFLDRACGHFDAVLMLAVLHHLLVTERVPLAEVMRLAADLTTKHLVIEYVAPEDRMFRTLTRGREELHQGLTRASFEASFAPYFDLVRAAHLPNQTRSVYLLARRRS